MNKLKNKKTILVVVGIVVTFSILYLIYLLNIQLNEYMLKNNLKFSDVIKPYIDIYYEICKYLFIIPLISIPIMIYLHKKAQNKINEILLNDDEILYDKTCKFINKINFFNIMYCTLTLLTIILLFDVNDANQNLIYNINFIIILISNFIRNIYTIKTKSLLEKLIPNEDEGTYKISADCSKKSLKIMRIFLAGLTLILLCLRIFINLSIFYILLPVLILTVQEIITYFCHKKTTLFDLDSF